MAKKKERILLKINALIIAMLGLLGCHSCGYLVKYGVPDLPGDDSTYIDTTIHCMYGVRPIAMYGVPGGEWAPQRAPQVPDAPQQPEEEPKGNESK